MTEKTTSSAMGTASASRTFHRSELESLHFVGSRQRLFKRHIDDAERRSAYDHACRLEESRDEAKARGKEEAEWVASVLLIVDGATALAVGEESKLRKDIANAEAKVHDARRREELLASALGYRWDEVPVEDYADDVDLVIISVRMDTLQEVRRRRMSESEEKASKSRRQVGLFEN